MAEPMSSIVSNASRLYSYKQPSGCWSQFLQNIISATLQRHSQLTQVIRPFTHSSKSIMLGKLRTRELLLAPIDRQAGEPH
jgi:hypothetical protein